MLLHRLNRLHDHLLWLLLLLLHDARLLLHHRLLLLLLLLLLLQQFDLLANHSWLLLHDARLLLLHDGGAQAWCSCKHDAALLRRCHLRNHWLLPLTHLKLHKALLLTSC
jgi:hypothetical protein